MFATVIGALNVGFLQTLRLFGVTLLGALPLGLIISFGSMSRFEPLRYLTRSVVWVIRGTPLMRQRIILYYIRGQIMGRSPWGSGETGRFLASAIAFIINYACYFSEIYRGGIQGVPVGQQEAGLVLGMTQSQIFFRVTLLQMIKRIVPPMSNEIITLAAGTDLGGLRFSERLPRLFRLIVAVVFYGRILYGFRGSDDCAFPLSRKETGLFPIKYAVLIKVRTVSRNTEIFQQTGLFQKTKPHCLC